MIYVEKDNNEIKISNGNQVSFGHYIYISKEELKELIILLTTRDYS